MNSIQGPIHDHIAHCRWKTIPSIATDSARTPDNAAIELAAQWNGPRCEKCEAPMKSDAVTICRRCGWYASLGQFVEVDQDWEAYDDEAEQPAEARQPSHVEVWLNLLPRWAWIVIATVAAVVVGERRRPVGHPGRQLLAHQSGRSRNWWLA